MLEKNRFPGDTVLIAAPGQPMFTITRTFDAPRRLFQARRLDHASAHLGGALLPAGLREPPLVPEMLDRRLHDGIEQPAEVPRRGGCLLDGRLLLAHLLRRRLHLRGRLPLNSQLS